MSWSERNWRIKKTYHIGIASEKVTAFLQNPLFVDVGLVRVWRPLFLAALSKNTEKSSEEIDEGRRSFTSDSADC